MKEKDLNEDDRQRVKDYKLYFNKWFSDNSGGLSQSSVKLYSRSVSLVAVHLLPATAEKVDIKLMLNILEETYDLDNPVLENIEIDPNLNNLNTLLNAIGKLIRLASNTIDISDKLKVMEEHIRKRSINLRDEIAEKKSRNTKTDFEEEHMRPFKEYVEVAEKLYEQYQLGIKNAKELEEFNEGVRTFLPKLKFRNIILVSLILLNKTKVDGVVLHSILRLVEYTDLILWTKTKKPPLDGKNYFSVQDKVIYLQHNKTTGGLIHGSKIQPTFKKFKIFNKKIIDMVKIYVEAFEIQNGSPLFTSTHSTYDENIPLNKTALSKLLKVIFSEISTHTTIGLIRKAYDNRKINMTGKQYIKSAKLNDHSIETVETFYKKV